MQSANYLMTENGYAKIKEELRNLEKIKRAMATREAPPVMISGEVNPEYIFYYQEMDLLEARLANTLRVLDGAAIAKFPDVDSAEGRISCISPVGSVLAGHRCGDDVQVEFPYRILYKISAVECRDA